MTTIDKKYLLESLNSSITNDIKKLTASLILLVLCNVLLCFEFVIKLYPLPILLLFAAVASISVAVVTFGSLRKKVKNLQMRREAIQLGALIIKEDEIYDKYFQPGGRYRSSHNWIYGKMYGRRENREIFAYLHKGDRVYYISLQEEFVKKNNMRDASLGDYLGNKYTIGNDLKDCLIPYQTIMGEYKFQQIIKKKKAAWLPSKPVKCPKCGNKFKLLEQKSCRECGAKYIHIPSDAEVMHQKEWYE